MIRSQAAPFWTRLLCILLMLGASLVSQAAWAASGDRISVVDASVDERDDGWSVNAQFDLTLPPGIDLALERGLSLYFVVEFELTRPRWYWFDEKPAASSMTFRLSYHALTREYRLSTGTLQLGFSTLAEALGSMTRIHDWHIAERSALRPGDTYAAALRMRLDTGELPKPFQINVLTSRDWSLESDWHRFAVDVPK